MNAELLNTDAVKNKEKLNNYIKRCIDIVLDCYNGKCKAKNITIILHSTDLILYPNRYKILEILKLIFPQMKITEKYLIEEIEYFNINFDWNLRASASEH